MNYVYCLLPVAALRRRHVGFTTGPRQRVPDRNAGRNPSTAFHRPWWFKGYVAFEGKGAALACEAYLKSGFRPRVHEKAAVVRQQTAGFGTRFPFKEGQIQERSTGRVSQTKRLWHERNPSAGNGRSCVAFAAIRAYY